MNLCLEAIPEQNAKHTKYKSYFILQSFLTPDRTFNETLPSENTLHSELQPHTQSLCWSGFASLFCKKEAEILKGFTSCLALILANGLNYLTFWSEMLQKWLKQSRFFTGDIISAEHNFAGLQRH